MSLVELSAYLFLQRPAGRENMINIRSVTTKPPTMLIDAKITATSPTPEWVSTERYRPPGSRRSRSRHGSRWRLTSGSMQGRGDLGDHLHADEDRQHEDRQPDDGFSVQLLAPLAADRALNPPTSSSLADQRRVRSLLLSTAARDPGFTCSLRSLRIAL